ncbi:LacI family transcriptional regulator [Anaerosolibacter carboniphilus]|uniref:LacI family transcriptional regulator n=1 Tax=Anaerosolibacter carboniphilus TaxID=1417629 RepID=A0A841KV69_9FIRM|nr:LacI family DNA-binding transcriptional regulator [Anaerosolibacter carboniphilus]MBB6215920.1 LacI family transcriptional regulator [Anaerosolibacter carboniphilus]
MKLTIKDIAKLAEVSTATVSKVINHKDDDIGQATKERVRRIMKEYNYVPNIMARSLVTKKTKTIGLVIPDIRNPFFPELARGAEDKANEEGYNIIFCNTDDVLAKEEKYIDMLIEKMIDGVIFTASSKRTSGFENLQNAYIPIILVDRDIDFKGVKGKITVNNFQGAYEGVQHLLHNGYRKIVFISGPLLSKPGIDRYEGYKKALSDAHIPDDSMIMLEGEYKSEWGYEAVKMLMEQNIEFDGLFCGDDLIAIGAIKSLKEEGISVPDDVGIVGFDDIYMASLIDPELTTIKQPNYEMGYEAASMLIRALEKKNPRKKEIVLNTNLVIRKSSIKKRY